MTSARERRRRFEDTGVTAACVLRELLGGTGSATGWLPALALIVPCALAAAWSSGSHAAAEQTPSARARRLLAVTADAERGKLQQPFTDQARSDWHYTPRRRSGIPLLDMTSEQRQATMALLRAALSDAGMNRVRAIMALEIALRQLETFNRSRDPENYALAIFGAPSASEPWGFRFEGHHLSLHFTLVGDRFVATLPQFMGANPALASRDFDPGGPRRGSRVLGKAEDLARGLMLQLPPSLQARARFDTRPYGDIVSGNAPRLSPLAPVGIAWADLDGAAQSVLLELIVFFAEHLHAELAEARLARVRSGGLDSIRFGWAGSLTPGEPQYFRIQGSVFLIELDNSGGNHIHSVWRDFHGDWGRDVLHEHYSRTGGGGHAH